LPDWIGKAARSLVQPPGGAGYHAGRVLAQKYRLVGVLGEGGMGAVWVAENLALNTRVALKLIRAEAKSADAEGRLLTEARAAAKLGHPAIVRVFDFGKSEEGDPYIVMELLEGEALAESLQRRARAPATRAVQLLLPIADALAVAHAEGIVHRDIKPENILLARTSHGLQPKILDFGVAKLHRDSGVSKLTGDGLVIGSPEYMSPEQARGMAGIDHRADVWAFTIVLYELIAGVLPFTGDNYNAIMASVIENEPLSLVELGIANQELWQIVERGLRKPPDQRWTSMREYGCALASWLWEQGIKEDATNASLEATWLATASTPPVDVFSAPRKSERLEVIQAELIVDEPPSSEWPSVASGVELQTIEAPRRGRRRWASTLALLAVLGGLAAGAIHLGMPARLLATPIGNSAKKLVAPASTQATAQAAAPPAQAVAAPAAAPPAQAVAAPAASAATSEEAAEPTAAAPTASVQPIKAVQRAAPARRSARATATAEQELKAPW
jgi:serine/threonine-protein kinase